jgi:hypothetical protein
MGIHMIRSIAMNNIVKRHAKVGLIQNYPAFLIADGISKLI